MRQTVAQPFRRWLEEQLELRGLVGPGAAARATGLNQSLLSRYLSGENRPNRRSVIAIAGGLKMPVADVQAALDQDPERFDSAEATARPPPELRSIREELRAAMDELAERLLAAPPTVMRGAFPFTQMLEAARPFVEGANPSAMVPDVLRAPHPLPVSLGAERVAIWTVDASGPKPGAWVRVGDRDASPPDIRSWAEGLEVTGVVAIVQAVPRV